MIISNNSNNTKGEKTARQYRLFSPTCSPRGQEWINNNIIGRRRPCVRTARTFSTWKKQRDRSVFITKRPAGPPIAVFPVLISTGHIRPKKIPLLPLKIAPRSDSAESQREHWNEIDRDRFLLLCSFYFIRHFPLAVKMKRVKIKKKTWSPRIHRPDKTFTGNRLRLCWRLERDFW